MDLKVIISIINLNDPLEQVSTNLKPGPFPALVFNWTFPSQPTFQQ